MEEIILQNKNIIKKNVKSKFKEKIWCDKELEEKRKLRYYKLSMYFSKCKEENKHC